MAKKTTNNSRANTGGQKSGSSGTTNTRNSAERRSAPKDDRSGLMKLFEHQLEDLYYVEKQLLKQLPTLADGAKSKRLAEALNDHSDETERHVKRLEHIFRIIDKPAKGQKCPAFDGIMEEAKDLMAEFKEDPALDAALVCAAQKVEHYEITSYGSLCAYAEELDMAEVCDLLERTLDEEKDADKLLSRLAEQALNTRANTYDETNTTTSRARAEERNVDDMAEEVDETEEVSAH